MQNEQTIKAAPYVKPTGTQELRDRIHRAKRYLPSKYSELVFAELPELAGNPNHLHAVMNLRSTSLRITETVEAIATRFGMPAPECRTGGHENHAPVNPPTAA